jgi:hypothetical protein
METTMTAAIAAAQGRGVNDHTKGHASTKAKARPGETMVHKFASLRAARRALGSRRRGVQVAISMSGMIDTPPPYSSLVKGEGADQPEPIRGHAKA